MQFTDIFIKRPVLACVISLLILILGLRAMSFLPIRQFPFTQNAVISVSTTYSGADPQLIAGFITTPLENSIAQANGIDYMTSTSNQNQSVITAYLRLNYDPNKALSEVMSKVNAVLNQLPKNAQQPVITIDVGQTIDAMYIGFYSKILASNNITDYLIRVVQPKLQAIEGVQQAEILGARPFALRVWLDPMKLAALKLTASDISKALSRNDFISAIGRTDGNMMTVNLNAKTDLNTVEEFKNLIIKSKDNAVVRLSDVANVTLGAQNYDSVVSFDGAPSVYIGIKVAPSANLLTVIDKVRKTFPDIQHQLPQGLEGQIVYDSTQFVKSAIIEVIKSLIEALLIVTGVVFLFLGSPRSVIIPVIAIPLSLIGAFFIMFLLNYSINLLSLLALILAIGLVVDDAIIIVENIHRHIEAGLKPVEAALKGAQELGSPIIAITLVLISVYVPIGFMGGLTGALFTEFAFTLAAAVTISAVIALTLSPMMCAKFLRHSKNHSSESVFERFTYWIDYQFERLREQYQKALHYFLSYLSVTIVFIIIVFIAIYFLYTTSKSELAPQEDQGIIISQLTASPNATLLQTERYTNQIYNIYKQFPETQHVFQVIGLNGLNNSISGMVFTPWDERTRTTNELQPVIQEKLDKIAGAQAVAFQLPSLPGSHGLPIQFVIQSTDSFERLNEINEEFLEKARASGLFMFLDTDLKIDKAQTSLVLDKDKAENLGLNMEDIGNVLSAFLSNGYINYFNFSGRSYQVIPQVMRAERLNSDQILNYPVTSANGISVPLSSIASLKTEIVPESLNHFQQLNAATISGVPLPGVTMGEALDALKAIAQKILPRGYTMDYAGQSRQYQQESHALFVTFFFAVIIIFLCLSALFESFLDPLIILMSVPLSICGALIFINLGVGGATLNIYTEVGLVTLIGLISKHGILIVQFANDLRKEGKSKLEAIQLASGIRLRPILMTTASMVLGVVPLIMATGAGAVSRFNIGLVIASGISIGTLFTLFVVPAMYLLLSRK